MVGTLELEIVNDVTRKETNSLLTGLFCEDAALDGWNYDLRALTDLNNKASRYLTTAGGHAFGLADGFIKTDWNSGVIQGLEYFETLVQKNHNAYIWTPCYKTGSFSVYHDVRRLFSDYSVMQKLDKDLHYEISTATLRDDFTQNSISCAIYKRLSNGQIVAERVFKYVDEFTGDLVDGERLETSDGSSFLVNNFSSRHDEWTLLDNILYLNSYAKVQIGIGNDLADIEETWEAHTVSEGGYIFLNYLNQEDVTVAVINEGVLTVLSVLDSIDYIAAGVIGYTLDSDLGVIQVTGLTANSIVIKETLNDVVTTIPCYYDEEFIALPERGVVEIDDELIAYQAKGLQSLEDCTRGYQGTDAAAHTAGAIAEFVSRGTFLPGTYYIKYRAIPRIDYEVTSHTYRMANKTNWLDVHPLTNLKSNKIIQIVSQTINLAEVILTTDETVIGGNLFGPIYFGTDVGRLTATAYDAAGNPVEDIELTIEKLYGPGSLNSTGDSYTAESNSSGSIYAVYNAPYDEVEVTLSVSDIAYEGADTLVTVPRLPTGVSVSDIYIYQILKHDPSQGTVGKRVVANAAGTAVEPWGLGYLECLCEYTEDFNNGTLQISYNGVRYLLNIRHAMLISSPGNEPVTRFYTAEYLSFFADSPFLESTVWLYQEEAEVWSPTLKRGAQVILYEYTTEYKHPITGLDGAYGPVVPDEITGTVLRYKDRHLPMPAPTDDESNLGAYTVVSPAEARFRAYGRDPYSGNMIVSNDVRFRVILPNTLIGVDRSGVLPVPYGFTFITDDFNIGAGLGGSNFITVNPNASGINQFTLRGAF